LLSCNRLPQPFWRHACLVTRAWLAFGV
jgi:hypothetical protein